MSTVINTNSASLAANQALALNQRAMEKTIGALSTGQRVNSAADDSAGMAISSKMTTQIRSLDMAVRNANDGISMLQTADGAGGQMVSVLFRMRELAIQSANDTNDQDGRDALQTEFSELQEQLTNTINNTSWNGMNLLDLGSGSSTTVYFQIGADSADSISLPLASLDSSDVSTVLANNVSIDSSSGSTTAIGLIDNAITQIDGERVKWGGMMNRLTYAADVATNVSMNKSASRSRILDTDYAQSTAELARTMILNQAGEAMLLQANQRSQDVLALLG